MDEPVKIYNFEVEDWHTYFVSESGILVHNTTDGQPCGAVDSNENDDTTTSEGGSKSVHGNSKTSTKPQHGYEIYNKKTGDVVKTGISGQTLNKNGTSPRANTQVNKFNKLAGEDIYDARIVIEDMQIELVHWNGKKRMH